MATRFLTHGTPLKGIRPALIAAFLFVLSGCFSFRVIVPPDPECVIGAVTVVRTDPRGKSFEEAIIDEPVVETDANIYSLIKVLRVSKPLNLQWLWYSPDNRLVRRSKVVEINTKGRYLAYFAAWDMLANSYYVGRKGNWIVVIIAGDSFLAQKEFTVN